MLTAFASFQCSYCTRRTWGGTWCHRFCGGDQTGHVQAVVGFLHSGVGHKRPPLPERKGRGAMRRWGEGTQQRPSWRICPGCNRRRRRTELFSAIGRHGLAGLFQPALRLFSRLHHTRDGRRDARGPGLTAEAPVGGSRLGPGLGSSLSDEEGRRSCGAWLARLDCCHLPSLAQNAAQSCSRCSALFHFHQSL